MSLLLVLASTSLALVCAAAPAASREYDNVFKTAVTVTCEGVDASGHIVGKVGERKSWKAAGFREGAYPMAAKSYRETALGDTPCADTPGWPVLKSYEGEHLRRVKMPLGGIGTGTVSLNGTGGLVDWEIRNRPDKGCTPSSSISTCFALRTETADGCVAARLLEGPVDPSEYEGESGAVARNHGFARWRDCTFKAAYPLAQVDLADAAMPVTATLEAMNPLLPGDADASGIPAALLRWKISNPSAQPLKASVICYLVNFETTGTLARVSSGGFTGARLVSNGKSTNDVNRGELALALPEGAGEISVSTNLESSTWMSGFDGIWRSFVASGRAADYRDDESKGVTRPMAAVCVRFDLKGGETKRNPFDEAECGHHYARALDAWSVMMAWE